MKFIASKEIQIQKILVILDALEFLRLRQEILVFLGFFAIFKKYSYRSGGFHMVLIKVYASQKRTPCGRVTLMENNPTFLQKKRLYVSGLSFSPISMACHLHIFRDYLGFS